jgi:hypothetical protein
MGERSVGSWWRNRLPDISAAAARFPLAVAIAALLSIYKLTHDDIGDAELRVLGALAASFLWAVAVDFYAEAQRRSFPIRAALWVAGMRFCSGSPGISGSVHRLCLAAFSFWSASRAI